LKDPSELIFGSAVANSYDALNIIAKGIELAGEFDRTKFRDALFKVKYDGLVQKYDPAFKDTLEGHDAIAASTYILAVWQDGILTPLAKTSYK